MRIPANPASFWRAKNAVLIGVSLFFRRQSEPLTAALPNRFPALQAPTRRASRRADRVGALP